MSLMDSEWCN